MLKNEKHYKSKILFKKPTQYVSLFNSNHPIMISYSINDYTNDTVINNLLLKKNWGKSLLILDSTNEYAIESLDSCTITSNNSFLLHFRGRLKAPIDSISSGDIGEQGESSTANMDTAIIVQSVAPIHILSPNLTNECNKIPYCWYEDMEIGWNQDINNENGIIIVAAWTGTILGEQTDSSSPCIYNVDLVEDNGNAILNNDIFQGMPDRAIVTLILLRANIVRIELDGIEELIIDPSWSENNDIYAAIEEYLYPHLEELRLSYTLARASVAYFSMVLVRDRSI